MKAYVCMMTALLAGCSSQAPAPVISGYNAQSAQVIAAQDMTAMQNIEPAAGPVNQVTKPLPAGVPATAPRATLPPPSIIGDVTRSFDSQAVSEKGWKSYEVQRGDTIYRLSREFNTSTQAILKANGMQSSSEMSEGQVVMIPAGIGRFAKADNVAIQVREIEQVNEGESVVSVEEPTPDAKQVVMGPSGTRYSLTRKESLPLQQQQAVVQTASVAPAMMEEDVVANIEPAAGPAKTVTTQRAAADEVQVTMHKVQAGETLYRIANQYGASVLDIMNANDLETPQDLKSGMAIKIPVAQGGPKVSTAQPLSQEGVKVASLKPSAVTDVKADLYKGKVDPAAARAKGYVWPVRGKVINRFGAEGPGVSQTGINIKVPANSPVMAAESGVVVYADNGLKTYGNLVLLRHTNGTVTAYAHNNALLVAKGEKVKKGQTIALSGNTGSVKDPQLHFEVRKNARAVDPMSVLPR